MKKLFNVIIALVMVAGLTLPSPVSAKKKDDFIIRSQVLVKYTGKEKNVTIPKKVKMIGNKAFAGNKYVNYVKIHGGIKSIGKEAFKDCKNLKKVKFIDGIRKIEGKAFANCKNLKSLSIPFSVRKIGVLAFESCKSLMNIEIKNPNVKIADNAFSKCNIDNIELSLLPDGIDKNDGKIAKDIKKESDDSKDIIDKKHKKEEKTDERGHDYSLIPPYWYPYNPTPEVPVTPSVPIVSPKINVTRINTVVPTISVKYGASKADWFDKLPKELELLLSNKSIEKVRVESWDNADKVDVMTPGSYEVIARYDLPSGVVGTVPLFKAVIKIENKIVLKLPTLSSDKSEYYYADNPVITIGEYNGNEDITIIVYSDKLNPKEKTLVKDTHFSYDANSKIITIKTDKIFEISKKNFEADTQLSLSVKLGKITLNTFSITYKPNVVTSKTVSGIKTAVPEIKVKHGATKADWFNQLPKELELLISDGTSATVNITDWEKANHVNTWKAGQYYVIAKYELPSQVEGSKPEYSVTITVEAKSVKPSLSSDKSEYYYADNPVITINNYTGNDEIKIAAYSTEMYPSDKALEKNKHYAYDSSNKQITINTDAIFGKTSKAFIFDTTLDLTVSLGDVTLNTFSITYKPGKKTNKTIKIEANYDKDNDGEYKGRPIFPYNQDKKIKLKLFGDNLNKLYIDNNLKVEIKSGKGQRFEAKGGNSGSNWTSSTYANYIEIKIPSTLDGIEYKKLDGEWQITTIYFTLSGYEPAQIEVVVMY